MKARTRIAIVFLALVFSTQPMAGAAATPSTPGSATIGGPANVVIATNRTDGRFVVQAKLTVNRSPGTIAAPLNYAFASSSCVDCQTLAVALQLDLASTDAHYVAPQNAAVAVNTACLRCVTIAHAVQFFYMVPDPTVIPPDVQRAMRDLDGVLREISTDPTITLPDAEARVQAVIAEFTTIAAAAAEQRTVAP